MTDATVIPEITFRPGTSDAEIEAAAATATRKRRMRVLLWRWGILIALLGGWEARRAPV